MKKWLLVLGMITCIFGVSACGSGQNENVRTDITEAEALEAGEQMVQQLMMSCSAGYEEYRAQMEKEDPVFAAAAGSWESAQADMGSYIGILEKTAKLNEDGVVIGSDHDADVEILTDDALEVTSITTNVIYSQGELMEKAALNTLLGMGTVFVILILISLIISCFNFIPKIQAAFTKPQPQEEKKAEPVDNTIAQIVEKEELSDDLELVAVIAAAVAASEGAVSTDGFVVRSIRKRKY